MEFIAGYIQEDMLLKVAEDLLNYYPAHRVFAFTGEMGVGKTTFIKSLCKILSVNSAMSSPSFSIINEYADNGNQPVYHFDFYRLKNIREAIDLGLDDYFFSGNYCFIEWPQLAEPLLPDETISVYISTNPNNTRNFVCKSLKPR
ncbi:MAG: tRNA (adenosine(37)-N6)-threonylcarbamoyltransferase complex ATPase subunit type 1 TsaE [Bacteroidetes bacterium]|nr:tRNA (adenosine(37)-N6)-threonylcarbamoyltransferase complex ATPase subunit type 1 TsaE [Bacteroidota bacterium]MBU1718922.1 tRNA (adenosine(37)-N6)-threonylcarbamoyltransferase complex ATPase subunit type 1 TsaE [Bacteroidota bacterium]